MKISYTESITMESYECCNCGLMFALTADFAKRRRDDHGTWYCPRGHPQVFMADSEAEKLRREVNRLKQDAARLEDEKRMALATANDQHARAKKAEQEVKRIQKRVHAGVCPDCNRTFVNVARHMVNKHHVPALKCVGAG